MAISLFNTKDASAFFNPFAGNDAKPVYLFAARSTPWADDLAIPDIETHPTFLNHTIFDEMIFGKQITTSDLAFMTRRYDWASGTVYDPYDPTDADLESKKFYAVYPEAGAYHVFKCLDNNGGVPSTFPPKLSETVIGDSQYYTADGYHWSYSYTIDSENFTKFATSDYMPVFANADVQAVATPGSIDAIILKSNGSSYYAHGNGTFNAVAFGGNTQVFALDPATSSSNNGFYVGSTVYIKSGSGAGELREIVSYTISGNNKLIGVNSAFSVLPDLTSVYQIGPKVTITGDGTGAEAIATVNAVTNTLSTIGMIKEGLGYTFANVAVTGNTGSISIANTAVATAVIAPKGGHGSDPLAEFYANKIGVSVSLKASDSNIPKYGTYRRIGILSEPLYSNVVIKYSESTGTFIQGEEVSQRLTEALDINVYDSARYQYTNQFDLSKYQVLQFSAPVSFANDHVIVQGGTSGVVVDKLSTNTLIVRTDAGTWSTNATAQLSSNALINSTISSISAGMQTGTIYGRDNSNTIFTFDRSLETLKVYVNNVSINDSTRSQPTDPQFASNATHLTLTNVALNNSSVIVVDRYSANLTQQEISVDTNLFVRGTVKSQNATHLTLDNVSGRFQNNEIIVGGASTAEALVVQIKGQDANYDQRTEVFGAYDVGSSAFTDNELIYQFTGTEITGWGRIHQIVNNNTFYLTEVKGVIEPSKYIQSLSGDKKVLVSSVLAPNRVPYTGDIRYVENFLPVQRSNTQSETIRFVLTFY